MVKPSGLVVMPSLASIGDTWKALKLTGKPSCKSSSPTPHVFRVGVRPRRARRHRWRRRWKRHRQDIRLLTGNIQDLGSQIRKGRRTGRWLESWHLAFAKTKEATTSTTTTEDVTKQTAHASTAASCGGNIRAAGGGRRRGWWRLRQSSRRNLRRVRTVEGLQV